MSRLRSDTLIVEQPRVDSSRALQSTCFPNFAAPESRSEDIFEAMLAPFSSRMKVKHGDGEPLVCDLKTTVLLYAFEKIFRDLRT